MTTLNIAETGSPYVLQDTDLVISGAGSHGITEAAVLCKLVRVMKFKRVGGPSAGSINAAGLALGFTPEYMVGVWSKLLTSGTLEDWKYPSIMKPLGMLHGRGGCMKGDRIRAALKEVFSTARMGDVQIPLRIKIGNMARRRTETVYSDLTGAPGSASFVLGEQHKKLLIVDVVMCSLAVPFLIDNQQLSPSSPTLYCDGGTADNVPRALWDDEPKRPTTVIRFLDDETQVPVMDFKTRLRAIINIMRDAAEDEASIKPKELIWDVAIKADGDALDFSLNKAECDRRVKLGQVAGHEWIEKNTKV